MAAAEGTKAAEQQPEKKKLYDLKGPLSWEPIPLPEEYVKILPIPGVGI